MARFLLLAVFLWLQGGLAFAATYEAPVVIDAPMPVRLYTYSYTEPKDNLVKQYYWPGLLPRSYYIYVPENKPEDGTKLPLLLLLHGSNRTGASLIDKWLYLAVKENIVLVAPNGLGKVWISTESETNILRNLVDQIQSEYDTDPQRTYIFGHSRGAEMTIATAARHSDRFAAASLHAGSYPTNWLKDIAKDLRKDFPVTFITGTDDSIFSLDAVRATARTFSNSGALVKQYEISGHNHWYYDVALSINKLAWEEMKQHLLPEPEQEDNESENSE